MSIQCIIYIHIYNRYNAIIAIISKYYCSCKYYYNQPVTSNHHASYTECIYSILVNTQIYLPYFVIIFQKFRVLHTIFIYV